jgi:ribonuclease D
VTRGVSDSDTVAALAERAREAGRLAVDTEFMGEGRYWPLLCLVAIAVDDGDGEGPQAVLIDPLEPYDGEPLAEALADPEVQVVVHAGRHDVALLRRALNTEITNVFDTQVAGAFVGLGANQGYGRLVQAVLNVRLDKGESFTRWDQRPLSERQLAYARNDVTHLVTLAERLMERLEDAGRLDWALDECKSLESATDERDPNEAWRRVSRVTRLSASQLAVARSLAAWRERTAATEDKPPSAVVGDTQLLELARRRPRDIKELREVRGLFGRTIKRRGTEILAAIEEGLEAEPIKLDEGRPPPDQRAGPLVAMAEALVRTRVQQARLAYELVATRAELTAFADSVVRGEPEPDVRVLHGWRRELVGAELIELLHGRRSLVVTRKSRVELRPVDGDGD